MPPKPPPDDANPGPGREDASSRAADVSALRLYSIHERQHISQIGAFAGTPAAGTGFAEWFASLPGFLGVSRLRTAVDAITAARKAGRPVAFAMGGHVVKVGCGPVVIDLMRRGIVTAIACHGATAIHDFEIALIGATSEDVGENIRDGRFGMVRETAEFFARAARLAAQSGCGYGAAVGRLIREERLPHAGLSVLASAAELGLPATVHVAIGTDTVHMPASADGGDIGIATLSDFRILCGVVEAMASRPPEPGGVWCNIGSAVLLPEVFLKAVSVARNLGANLDELVTVNLDQLRHYRPAQNVIGRPVGKGHGLDIAGHHEILLPLLRQALIERSQ